MEKIKMFGFEVGKGKHYEEIIYAMALLYNVVNNEIASQLKDFKLTPAKFNALMVIKHQGGKEGISQVEISKRLIVTASNMTRLLDKMEKEKLIVRVAQEGDRRVNVIQISEKGYSLLDKAWPGYIEKVKGLAARLNQEEQKDLAGLLLKWLDHSLEK
jgi:DNA-binding MarR family transcriptional regulator